MMAHRFVTFPAIGTTQLIVWGFVHSEGDGVGTLDSARTQIVMESLLQAIVETGSKVAILDITGVPTVDTQTAQHLIKTVSATRLMGAECIISGIRPQIAQTIVHLGIDIYDIPTKAKMSDAIKDAMERTGWKVVREVANV